MTSVAASDYFVSLKAQEVKRMDKSTLLKELEVMAHLTDFTRPYSAHLNRLKDVVRNEVMHRMSKETTQ